MSNSFLIAGLLLSMPGWVHASGPPVTLGLRSDVLIIKHRGGTLPVSLKCPHFIMEGMAVGGNFFPACVKGDIASGQAMEVSFPSVPLDKYARLEVKLFLRWFPKEAVLRKWARFRLSNTGASRLLKEVVLEEIEAAGRQVQIEPGQIQSYPAFMEGFFAGIEFPVAATRLEQGHLLLAHRPGLRMWPEVWYETRKAVLGVASRGEARLAFQRYIALHRPRPCGIHANYNSWWSSPVPYTEKDILTLMKTFEAKLYRPYGVSFDTFCIDMGWSDVKSVWEIDPKLFPQGFARIQQAARRMKSRLGLWISPGSCYPGALDNEWAREQGYETFAQGPSFRYACLGGSRYQSRFQERLVEMVSRFGIRHIKFDGYVFECPEADHGHEPGSLSSEAIADGIISVFKAVRRAAPDIWLEPTCFGWNPSPWWLFYVNSVIGTYGDDAPYGRVPAPIYRESYTTARDFFNLQGAYRLPAPVAAQEVLGIVHQTREPFLNDAVMVVMRGHQFLPLYLNPAFMDDRRWQAFADLLKWARRNASVLENTYPLLPASWRDGKCPLFSGEASMPREPYGYAHWKGNRSLVAIRNPWIAPQTFLLKLDGSLGIAESSGKIDAVSLYPEVRLYGKNLRYQDILAVPLAPYETLVLSLGPHRPHPGIQDASEVLRRYIRIAASQREIARARFEGDQDPFGPDWTCPLGEADAGIQARLEVDVGIASPQAELLLLMEGRNPPACPLYRLHINGMEAPVEITGSETGWAASGLPRPENWLFLRTPLTQGKSHIALDLFARDESVTLSAWIWATKPGRTDPAIHPNALPGPEIISLEALPLMEPLDASTLPPAAGFKERPVERIAGVFLDALKPVSASQGWGTLQRNKSVWEKPMTIAGKRFLRGLGTHAPSRIIYALDGQYRRFQSWVGADSATAPTITFELQVDGQTRWESGLMKREDAARWVDVDVAGAKTLELIVGDGGNGINGDHADWAEARLIR